MRILNLLLLAACGACGSSSTSPSKEQPAPSPSPSPADAVQAAADAVATGLDPKLVARLWPDGCFMIRDATGAVIESDRERCAQPRRPYSTFKVPNALIGVDAGILDGADSPMTWDAAAIPDRKDWRDAWRKPHTLRSGMKVSAVPHFRTLALQIGAERMRAGLAKLGYGNQDMSGGHDLFWLSGGMRISAAQQLALVEGLARGKLAVSARAQEVVREITELEKAGGAALHGKTGTGPIEDGKGGWLALQVGWVARDGKMYPYASWMEVKIDDIDEARAAREKRLRETLDALGVFPKAP